MRRKPCIEMNDTKSVVKSWLAIGAISLPLIGGSLPAHAISWGGFSIDPNPVHPSIGVPGAKIEAHPFNPLTPVPSVHIEGNGEIAKAVNGINDPIQKAPTEALRDMSAPLGVIGGVLVQPAKDLGASLRQDFQNAVDDLQKRVQQGATDAKGGLITMLIEAGIVVLCFKFLSSAVGSMFRRRSHS
jgi:hypothetical protein